MNLALAAVLAFLPLAFVTAARAQGAPSGADVDGQRHAMTDDEKIAWYCEKHADEGANCDNHARLMLPYISDYAQYEDSDTRGKTIKKDPNGCDFSPLPAGCPGSTAAGGGSGGGVATAAGGTISGGPLTASVGGGGAGKGKVLAFPTWSSAAPIRDPNTGRVIANYNSYGPGTIFSMGFKAEGSGGLWTWVENINSTAYCKYSGWISESPGGPPLPAGYQCNPDVTNSFGSYRNWMPGSAADLKDAKKNTLFCRLAAGQRYYFNLQLVEWSGNPNYHDVYSCIEYITPQGDLGAYYKE